MRNRHTRRAAAAKAEHALNRDDAIRLTLRALAKAGPIATGATLYLPSGEVLHLDAETARAMAGKVPTRGPRQ